MSGESSSETSAPNLNLSAEEKRVYGQLFRQADTEGAGIVTGDVAVKFFEKTRLDSRTLGEIWQIADNENRGFLTPTGFGIVLRLIAHAQAGHEPSAEMALKQGPIPRFDGISIPSAPAPSQPSPLQAQGTGGVPIRIPPLTPEKVAQYSGLFEHQNLQAGNLLPGDAARTIFEKSGLANEVLGRIWQLADTEQRGGLVLTEFVIAMHLLTSMKTGALRGLPTILPAALYEAATRRGQAPRQSPTPTGQSMTAIPRQFSGQGFQRAGSPLARAPIGPPQIPQQTGSDWLVTPADKGRFDQIYNDLDKTGKGFITGEEAVPFLSQSNLSEDMLAQVWDLADINGEGRLNRDSFAVAMYLIRQQRTKRDGSSALPSALPPNLIPPSFRTQQPPPASNASPFDAPTSQPPPAAPPIAQKSSALDDLFGLDAPGPAPTQAPLSTGGSVNKDPFATASPMAPASPVRASPTTNNFKPFAPSSSFGRMLASHDTGGSGSTAPASKPNMGGSQVSSANDDLLGDNDPEISKKLTNETAELANLSNQIGSLSEKMQQVQGQRATTQKDLTQANQQKRNFEDRLAQLGTMYEKEVKDVNELKDQLQKSRDDTRKLMTDMATADGSLRDLQAEHQQLSAALQADQEENAKLKQRISAANTEIAQLKPQIEKLKSDARQQKGFVAINKKQLSTTEGERDKLKTEAEDLTKSNEEMSRQIESSSPPPPAAVASPALSNASGSNPFFRRTGSSDIMGAFSSPPPPKPYGEKSFDDIFGGFTGPSSSTPPPPTSFKQENMDTSTASVASFATPPTASPTVSRQEAPPAEPPAPPLSRQITSSLLPLGETTGSLTSSRQASPPLSRVEEDGALGGAAALAAAVDAPATTRSVGPATESTIAATNSVPETTEMPTAISNGAIPGAFPAETPMEEIESHFPPVKPEDDVDPFEGMKKDTANAKDDFDSAFAGFGGSSKAPERLNDNNTAEVSNFHSEFPPISELQHDDEDSDSGDEGNGFDDDFTSASPPSKKKTEQGMAKAEPHATEPERFTSTAVPAAGATPAAKSAAETLPPFPQPPAHSNAPVTAAAKSDPFSGAPEFAPAPTTVTNTAPVVAKGAFDDLDDDFEGLEDAKEGSADDEFANVSRSNLDDFNPVFDSSPPHSQAKSESTNVSNAFGQDSSFDFGSASTTAAGMPSVNNGQPATTTTTAAPASAAKAPEGHDWDAIFASLDEPTSATATASKAADDLKNPSSATLTQPRPATGRALTEDGIHDDPILKNLTSMGYSRTDALSALEKYDYNLERAANHLANQS